MGEEKKKAGEKQAEAKKNKAQNKKKPEEEKKPEKSKKLKPKGEKKSDDARKEKDGKVVKDKQPLDIVLQVNIDCKGCAEKVSKCLEEVDGVESVKLDRKENKVLVKGKANPRKLRDLVHKKIGRNVELLSPISKPKGREEKSPASSSRICLHEEQGWIKVKKCNCKPAKFFAVKVSPEGWPYYACDGCGEKSWVKTNEFVRSCDLSVTVNNGNNMAELKARLGNMAELKARLAGSSVHLNLKP